ncbi:MAG: DUF2974 domain-containing protein [Lachnospiraceae bacterium]|nr:DUF2974 domain-containing protein [Lachnospiraceae bacterium]
MGYTDKEMAVFSEIAYIDLEDALREYRIAHPGQNPTLAELNNSKVNKIMKEMGMEDKLGEWRLAMTYDDNDHSGMYACVIETDSKRGEATVAFRGSEPMDELGNVIHDWVNGDLKLLNSTCTKQHEAVEEFYKKYASELAKYSSLAMTGHSLGGNLAEYATIVSYKYGLDKKIIQCVSNDGPGFSNEFIAKYYEHILAMSDIMDHKCFSIVGQLLFNLPGVSYEFGEVKPGTGGGFDRHGMETWVFNEDGSIERGDQDYWSRVLSISSEIIDLVPEPLGDAFITLVSGLWIGGKWAADNWQGLVMGIGILAAVAPGLTGAAIAVVGGLAISAIVVVAAVALAVVIVSVAVDFIIQVGTYICEQIANFVNWAADRLAEFRDFVMQQIENIANWFRETFDAGTRYSRENPEICIDTYKMYNYASRLSSIANSIDSIKSSIWSIYGDAGITQKHKAREAAWAIGSGTVRKCANYLNDTAAEFERIEREIKAALGG